MSSRTNTGINKFRRTSMPESLRRSLLRREKSSPRERLANFETLHLFRFLEVLQESSCRGSGTRRQELRAIEGESSPSFSASQTYRGTLVGASRFAHSGHRHQRAGRHSMDDDANGQASCPTPKCRLQLIPDRGAQHSGLRQPAAAFTSQPAGRALRGHNQNTWNAAARRRFRFLCRQPAFGIRCISNEKATPPQAKAVSSHSTPNVSRHAA